MTFLLQAATLAVFTAVAAPNAIAQNSSPLATEKVQAKEAAVAAHAAKKKACKAEAKAQGLHLKKRMDFVRDCMAAK